MSKTQLGRRISDWITDFLSIEDRDAGRERQLDKSPGRGGVPGQIIVKPVRIRRMFSLSVFCSLFDYDPLDNYMMTPPTGVSSATDTSK